MSLPSLQDLARPGFLPVRVGFFAGKANDQVVLHDVVNGVALRFQAQKEKRRRRTKGVGEILWHN